MRQLNDKPGLASFLTVVLLFAGPAALRAGDRRPSLTGRPTSHRSTARRSPSPPSTARLRDTAERDPRALGPLSIGTPDAGLLLNPVLFPEGAYWTLREPGESWATDETIDFIVNAIEAVEARYPGLAAARDRRPEQSRRAAASTATARTRPAATPTSASTTASGQAQDFRTARPKDLDATRTWALRPGAGDRDRRRAHLHRPLADARPVRPGRGGGRGPSAGLPTSSAARATRGSSSTSGATRTTCTSRFYNRRAQEARPPRLPDAGRDRRGAAALREHRVRGGETLGSARAPLRHERPRDPPRRTASRAHGCGRAARTRSRSARLRSTAGR